MERIIMEKEIILNKVDHTLLAQTATWEEIKQILDDAMDRMTTAWRRQISSNVQHLQRLSESSVFVNPMTYLQRKQEQLKGLQSRLSSAQVQQLQRNKERYVTLAAKLDAMSPLKVLSRGYAMVQTEDGEILRSVSQIEAGERISVSLGDGQIRAEVLNKKENRK